MILSALRNIERIKQLLAVIDNTGQTGEELHPSVPDLKHIENFRQLLKRMVFNGQLCYCSVKIGNQARATRHYFTEMWARDQFHAEAMKRAKLKKRASVAAAKKSSARRGSDRDRYSVVILTASQKPKPKPAHKFGAWAEGKADESRAIKTIAPTPKPRFYVDPGEIGQGFGKLGIGRYLPQQSCAGRAA